VVVIRVFLTLLIAFAFVPLATAQGNVLVSVDRDTVVQGEVFRITVQATGDRLGEPELPEVSGLQISPHPVYRSIQTNIVNGRTSTSKVRGYNAVAQQPGTIAIPPIGVRVGDDIALSQPVTITVIAERHGASGRGGAPGDERIALEDALQLTADVDKNEVYQGERLRVTYTLWAVANSRVKQNESEFPATMGFYAIPREPQRIDDGVDTTRDGLQYTAVHWEQVLYPTKTGEVDIGPWVWSGIFVPPYSMRARNVSIATDPVTIVVKPLPRPPKGFGGAVGSFDISVRKPAASPIRGVPFDLVVTIEGHGNPDAIQAPPLPEVDWAYVAEPQREPGRDPRTAYDAVERSYVYTITPMEDGPQKMPGIGFCYFNPELEEYVTATTDSLEWEVRPSTEPDQRVVVENGALLDGGVEVLGRDILPIVTNTATLARRKSLVWTLPPVAVLPPLAYGGLALFIRHRRRLSGDSRYARSHRAMRLALRRLAAIHELPDPVDGLYKALAGYVADIYHVQEAGMTSADVESELSRNGVDEQIANGIVRILQTCERSRYGSTALSDDEVSALIHGALLQLEHLEAIRNREGVR